jgi:hypothetical protein
MAQVSKVPVSRLIKQGEDEDGPTKKSRDEYRKAKELEEARYHNTFSFSGGRRGLKIGIRQAESVFKIAFRKIFSYQFGKSNYKPCRQF